MKVYYWLMLLVLLVQPYRLPSAGAQQDIETQRFSVRFEPSPYLVTGDIVSIEVAAPLQIDLTDHTINLRVIYPIIEDLGSTPFFPSADRPFRARFPLVWNTGHLQPGTYILQFSIQPGFQEWKEVVFLDEPVDLAPDQHWRTLQLDCCNIHVITGTRAENDLQTLAAVAEEQVRLASERMNAVLPEPVNIVFLPRVIGHGGFAAEELYISYPDINYTNIDLSVVLHHEIVHRLDRELGGPHRPSLFVEGIAVYLSGGHFKAEDLVARSSALLELGGYIPLAELADNFYPAQHESGYMLAGALVDYLVNTYGWDGFSQFYRNIQPPADGRDSVAIDLALQQHFNLTFDALEERFIAFLQAQPFDPDEQTDVRLTIAFYDTLRLYQQHLDPSAYFRNVWHFPDTDLRERGIVTHWSRWPSYPQNLIIERLLEAAGQDLLAGNYSDTEEALEVIQLMLPGIPRLDQLPYRPAFTPIEIK
jgi:hypothetical protein